MYQNRANLIGFLGKDAEVRTTTSNASFTVLSLATKRSWKNRESGEYQSQTTWHRCIVWGKLGEYAATLTKGAHLQIEGEIRTREHTQKIGSGKKAVEVKKSITEDRVQRISRLDQAPKSEGTREGRRVIAPDLLERSAIMTSQQNREKLVLGHMPQVELLEHRVHRRCPHLDLDDLIHAGAIGLIQAVGRFDPTGKLKLKTFAEHRINGALLDYLRHIDPLPRNIRAFRSRAMSLSRKPSQLANVSATSESRPS